MKRHSIPDMKEGGVNVTPLIDIVMVLIVFFMLVAKIGVTRGEDSDIPLPSAIMGKSLDSMSNTLTLNVHWNKNGDEPALDALIDGNKRDLHLTRQYSGGKDQELARVLTAWRGAQQDKANLIIRADQDMPYRQLEQVLLAAAQAEIGNISYEARQGEAPAQ
jgi:biopolymer transport protein ExbD